MNFYQFANDNNILTVVLVIIAAWTLTLTADSIASIFRKEE